MARIFVSHSAHNNDWAVKVRDWLAANGWSDLFLDLDPQRGLAPGERWQDALKTAADRCEAVLFLISPQWQASGWCLAEFLLARQLGKRIFPILISNIAIDTLPVEMTSNHQAVDLVNDPLGWDRLKEGLRRAGLDPETFQFAPGRRPYPGFEPLLEDDAAIFFGREAQIVRGLDRLRAMGDAGFERALIILGASGAGKSSFLRAGLWPRLRRDDRNFLPLPVMRPERGAITGKYGLLMALEQAMADPRVASHPAIQALPRARAAIAELLAHDTGALARIFAALRKASTVPLQSADGAPEPSVVIALDQAEELFNEEGRREAEQLMDLLSATLQQDRRLLVVMAIRSDSYPQLQNEPRLGSISKEPFDLSPMPSGSLRLIIEGPARVTDPPLKLDPQLVEALMADASSKNSLPLLAFALGRLYKEYGATRQLSLAEYVKLGKISGALNAAVAEVIDKGTQIGVLPRNARQLDALLRETFIPHLARVNRAGEFGRRIAVQSEMPERVHPIVDLFVEQHLLIKDRRKVGDAEADVIEVAHEALLREWPVLRAWLDADREFLTGKEQLAEDIREWKKAGRRQNPDALLSGIKLSHARDWLNTRAAQDLNEAERGYITASAARADKIRRVRRQAWGLAGASLVVVAAVAVWYAREASVARDRARDSLALVRTSSGSMIKFVTGDLRNVQGIQTTTLQRILDVARGSFEKLATAFKDDPSFLADRAEMMGSFGESYVKAGNLVKAEEAHTESLEIYRQLYAAQPEIESQRNIASQIDEIGVIYKTQNKYGEARAKFDEALALRRVIAERRPDDWITERDLASSHYNLGEVLMPMLHPQGSLTEQKEAQAHTERALSLADNAHNRTDLKRKLSVILTSIAVVYEDQRRQVERKAALLESNAIRRELVAADADNAEDKRLLGWSYSWLGGYEDDNDNLPEALRYYREALKLRSELVAADSTNNRAKYELAWAYHNSGAVALRLKQFDDAERYLVEARSLREQLSRTDDTNKMWRKDVALSHTSLGDLAKGQGQPLTALGHYEKAREVFEGLLVYSQIPANYKVLLSQTYNSIAAILKAQNDLDGALASYNKARDLRRGLYAAATNSQSAAANLATSESLVADVLRLQANFAGALEHLEAARSLRQEVVGRDPANTRAKGDLEKVIRELEALARQMFEVQHKSLAPQPQSDEQH